MKFFEISQIMWFSRQNTIFLVNLSQFSRNSSTSVQNNFEISAIFTNRNPRNLERLRIGYKPDGYHVENPGRRYWHKLELSTSGKYVRATVRHFERGPILTASTSEWPLKKQLYRGKDASAYINLGRVLADRCLKIGLCEIYCNIESARPDGNVALFLNAVKGGGVKLEEPPQFKPDRPWDQVRKEKPWEVTE